MRRKIIVPNNELLDNVATMIASGERVTILTKGASMLPFIVGGRDSVELSPIISKIKRGDIILAKIPQPEQRYVIHRVIKIEGNLVTLMGDGNLVGTEQCQVKDAVARITSIIKPHKNINPNSNYQQLRASIWRTLRPLRRYLLAIYHRLSI